MLQLDITSWRFGYCDGEATGAVIAIALYVLAVIALIQLYDHLKERRSTKPGRHRTPRRPAQAVPHE